MKSIIIAVVILISCSVTAYADLFNRGTDDAGNRLIYDSDLNITWYDYTNSFDTWQNQVGWASTLSVSGGSLLETYDNWRLPASLEAPWFFGFDGSSTVGLNITSSEMGHLFYTELGNIGHYDTTGTQTSCGGGYPSCLANTNAFQNLLSIPYWSGTERIDATGQSFTFDFFNGDQLTTDHYVQYSAMAVRDGDVAIVPEPISSILFMTGGTLLAGRRFIKRKKTTL